MDGIPANIYYSDNNAGTFPVYPDTGIRISDNKKWYKDVCINVSWAFDSYTRSQVQNRCNANNTSIINDSNIIIWMTSATQWYGRYHSWDNNNRSMATISKGNIWK